MNFEKYANKKKWPTRPDYTTYNVYHKGETLAVGTSAQQRDQVLATAPEEAVIEKVFDDAAFRAAHDVYLDEEQRIADQFWQDFADQEGVSVEHPKFVLLKRIAWERGHSSGWSEIYNVACDLVEFLR